MKTSWQKKCDNHLWVFLLYALIAITLLAPLGSNTFSPNIPDLFNHLTLIAKAKTSLLHGQLILKTFLNGENGEFYPFYQFYSPTTFTLAGLMQIFLPGNNPYITYKLMLALFIICSGFYMQALTVRFIPSKNIAIITSIVFITAPYFIMVINQLAGFCEMLGIYLIPVILYYNIVQYTQSLSLKNIIKTVIAWYLLMTVHLITSLYTAIFVASFFSLLSLTNGYPIKRLLGLALSFVISLLAACWFLAPVIQLGQTFYISGSFNDLKTFSGYFPPLASLLAFNANYIDVGKEHLRLIMYPSIGWPILSGALFSLLALCSRAIPSTHMKNSVLSLLILFFITLFLICSPINIWGYLPHFFMVCQYSWRLLGQTAWLGALLAGYALYLYMDIELTKTHVALIAFIILASGSTWLTCSTPDVNSVDQFIQNPTLVFNSNSYIIDLTKHPEYINRFENIFLSSLVKNNNLIINKPYNLNHPALTHIKSFKLNLSARISPQSNHKLTDIVVFMDKKIVYTHSLDQPTLNIDLTVQLAPELTQHVLVFKLRSHNQFITTPVESIHIEHLLITHLAPQQRMAILTAKNCYALGHRTYCQYYANSNTDLLELPIYYYPNMWAVRLDGKPTSYFCSSNATQPKLAIQVPPGRIHDIQVTFTGLVWANRVSFITWACLLLSLLFSFFIHFIKQKNHAHTLE